MDRKTSTYTHTRTRTHIHKHTHTRIHTHIHSNLYEMVNYFYIVRALGNTVQVLVYWLMTETA